MGSRGFWDGDGTREVMMPSRWCRVHPSISRAELLAHWWWGVLGWLPSPTATSMSGSRDSERHSSFSVWHRLVIFFFYILSCPIPT